MSARIGEAGPFRRLWRRLFGPTASPGLPGSPAADESDDSLPEAYEVTDFLDLHGFWPEQVEEVVGEFLRNARRLGLTEVRIAHGKGKSVMRREVWRVLERHPLVAEFKQAPPDRGSWGATIVRHDVE